MEIKKNFVPSQSNNKGKEHNAVHFCDKSTINENNTNYKKIDMHKEEQLKKKEQERLERIISQKIELLEKESEQLKKKQLKQKYEELEKTEILDLDENTAVIPSIPLKKYIQQKKAKKDIKKESWFDKWIKNIKEKRDKNRELKKIEREKQEKELWEKKQRELLIKRQREEELANKKLIKQKEKEEKELKKKENQGVDALNIQGLSNKGLKEERRLKKELERKRIKESKELKIKQREEQRKKELREKYEREAIERREKEEKQISYIKERQEKKKKIEKEKEQARLERREKARLIKQAQEESRLKAKREKKTFEEKLKDWYNNLSFVRDAQNRREMRRQTLLIDFEGDDSVRSDEKIMYKYVAKNIETGKIEKGYFSAFSKLDVHSFLIAEGYEVYEIAPQRSIASTLKFLMPRLKSTDLDFFLTQLSTFLKSGITLIDSVKVLSKQSKRSSQKQIYKSIIYELSMGENFSEALAKQGTVFPKLLVNMVKTSELTGDLPETLDDMANYYREIEKTRKQMISALTYPMVVLVFAVSVLIYIMVAVIPQFVSIYSDLSTDLPTITVAIINISKFLQTKWAYVISGVFAIIILFIMAFKTVKVFRTVVQSMLMNTPIIGKIIIYNEVTMFTKTFASLLNHNVYITDSMEVLSKITNNEVYKMLIFDTITNLAKGEVISNSFKNHWAFPNIAYEMILTGEKTGQLGNMMDKVANYYQEQHKNAVNQIKAFIEPVMIVILAAIVGVVLLSVVLPMFDIYQNLS